LRETSRKLQKAMPFFKHDTAIIDEGAVIGDETKIWHFCHIMPHCKIGNHCILGQNVFIGNHAEIGNRVKLQNNVSVYEGVVIEDDVFIGPSVVFTNVINPRSFIDRKNEFKKTMLRKGASIGANATILCGAEIGSYAMIAAGAMVIDNVKPYSMVAGNPARHKGWVSEEGEKLHFDESNTAVCAAGSRYRLTNDEVFKIIQ
jgi:UDP-2-acetamido-3-amino-2,3-dideoxy-glucuronate N-acetyltransferase